MLENYSFLRRAGLEQQSEMFGKTNKDLFTDEHACQALALSRELSPQANQWQSMPTARFK